MAELRPHLFPLPVALFCSPIRCRFLVRPQLVNRIELGYGTNAQSVQERSE
jgi:hypothetical protein